MTDDTVATILLLADDPGHVDTMLDELHRCLPDDARLTRVVGGYDAVATLPPLDPDTLGRTVLKIQRCRHVGLTLTLTHVLKPEPIPADTP